MNFLYLLLFFLINLFPSINIIDDFVFEKKGEDFNIYALESIKEDSPLEKIKNYQKFLFLNFNELKIKIDDVVGNIKKYKNNEFKLKFFKNFFDLLVEVNLKKEKLQQLIYQYEKIIDILFKENLSDLKNNNLIKNNFDIEKIYEHSVELYFYNELISDLETELNVFNINSNQLLNYDENEKLLKENYDEDLIEDFKTYKEKLLLLNEKIKDLEIKILATKRNIIKERIKNIKNFFNKLKNDLIVEEKSINQLIDLKNKKIEALLEKKYEKIKEQNEVEKWIDDYCLKNNLNINNLNLEKLIDDYIFILNNNSDKDSNKSISEKIKFIYKIFKKETLVIEIELIGTEINIVNNYINFIDGWIICLSKNLSTKKVNDLINKIKSCNLKENLEEIIKNKNKIFAFNNFLLNINNYFLLNKESLKDKDTLLNDYLEKIKLDIFNITSFNNKIIDEYKKNIAANLILQEELKSKNFWSRSEYSVEYTEIKNFLPNIKNFFYVIKNGMYPFIKESFYFFSLKSKTLENISLLYMIIGIIIVFISGLFLRLGFIKINIFLIKISAVSSFSARANLFISFLLEYGYIIYYWVSFFILFKLRIIPSNYAMSIYCIGSFPILIFFINKFFNWFERINKEKNFIFIASDYIDRFIFIIKIFLIFSLFIFLFKEAFISINYKNDSILYILNGLHFILFQISLIGLIKKDKIISFLPDKNHLLFLIREFINAYYYLFLFFTITIIIMSNPYVGYGTQVFYILKRSIITIIIVFLIKNIFEFLRDKSVVIFFKTVDGDMQNKIPAGNIIYLLFNAILILFLYFLGIVFLFKIYDMNINIESFYNILNKNLLIYTEKNNSSINSMALLDIVKVLYFTLFGYVISYIFNFIFISKILNPLIIGQSVKNTIITIVKYIIVVSMFIIGLYSAGLQSITTKLAVIIGFLGFAIKEPFADFFSYFIILVQRPIKMGDFVRININGGDSDITGIVRNITPRTTLIRQRNSQTVIIPNSMIISRYISNWNFYKNGFVAVDDIFIPIDFNNDLEFVRLTIYKSLEGSNLILKNPIPIVRCERIGLFSFDFLVRGYIIVDKAQDQFEIASQIRILIIKKLKEENIKLAMPNYKLFLDKIANNKDD